MQGVTNPAFNASSSSENVQLTSIAHADSRNLLHYVTSEAAAEAHDGTSPSPGPEVVVLPPSVSDHVPTEQKGEEVGEGGAGRGKGATQESLSLEYGVTDVPPLYLCVLFGLQHVFLSISGPISIALIVSGALCARDLPLVRAEIISTSLFMCGVTTILQVLLGIRLPIVQGSSGSFIPAVFVVMTLDRWQCPSDLDSLVEAFHNGTSDNVTEVWQSRMREIQGGIMLASLVQIVLGCTGLLGLLLRYVGPLTVGPAICLIGLSLVDVVLGYCQTHWGISALTVGLLFLFSLYLRNIRVPFPSCTGRNGCRLTRYPMFILLSVLLSILLAWGFCAVLTATDTLKEDGVRTDSISEAVDKAQWFFFPYPGQWGRPTVSVASFVAMLSATIVSIVESVGDYYACARIAGVPSPPTHAINRGIAIEGLGSLISGAVGSGGTTTSYSQNVGAIGFTKVASRWVVFTAGAILLLSGVCGKIGAVLTAMPDPVLGGIFLVGIALVTALGLSYLAFVQLSSTRNLTILGSALIVGLMVPRYMAQHPNAIDTGNPDGDQVLQVLLSSPMLMGGLVAFLLDNTVPGTPEERGITLWRQWSDEPTTSETTTTTTTTTTKADNSDVLQDGKGDQKKRNDDLTRIYGFPLLANCLEKIGCCRFVPFMPHFAYDNASPIKWLRGKFQK